MKTEKQPPLLLLSTDWHLEKNSIEVIKDLVIQKCELALELGVGTIFLLGDIFDSRKGQELVVLHTFLEILVSITKDYGLSAIILPGNHDKVDYRSESSYIAPFQYLDNVHYVQNYLLYELSQEVNIYLLPFFEQEVWINYYNEMLREHPLDKSKKNILLTHTAFSNSINNDGSKVTNSSINYALLKDWDLVLSGHYHDYQQPFKNTYHIPSIRQKNFGEDTNKGFTLVHPDLSLEVHKAIFPEYRTHKVNLSTTSVTQVKSELESLQKDYSNIRLIVEGPTELVQSFNSQEFEQLGIKVKKNNPEVEASLDYVQSSGEIEELTSDKILELFQEFCEKEELSFEEGIKYLRDEEQRED